MFRKAKGTFNYFIILYKLESRKKKKKKIPGVEKEKEIKRRTSQQKACANLDSCDGRRNYV
jgi:hypothetical protein